MAQLFAHILPKRKEEIGEITVKEVSEKITTVSIPETDLLDLLVHFVCERTGLSKKDLTSIKLNRSLYGDTDISHYLTARFVQ